MKQNNISVEGFVSKLMKYDIVSFDIFDTLIFRPLSEPADLFYFTAQKLNYMDYKNIRICAEADARGKNYNRYANYEVSFPEIWENMSEATGIVAHVGMEDEINDEKSLCYANPFMLEVWKSLIKAGKRILVVSDMYLPTEVLGEILRINGFSGYEELFVSNKFHKSKAKGDLYDVVKAKYPGCGIVHVGDNPVSDVKKAVKAGISVCPYPQVNSKMLSYRPYDMSPMIGSAYRGIVSNYIYSGSKTFSMEYEYGYIYGGLFVLGYCNFIHEYAVNNKVDKLLFLSRDGDILKQVYERLYPDEETLYVYWSRKAALKLMADYDKNDYFRRFIYHKQNQKYTVTDILKSMEISELLKELPKWKDIWEEYRRSHDIRDKDKFIDLKANDELTDKNGYLLRHFIEANWEFVLDKYSDQQRAAREYFSEILDGIKRAVAVDIGWAGSGAMALSFLVENVWKLDTDITGLIAGTNTIHNAEPDASEAFLQSGKLVSYLYSQQHNRDLLKYHNPSKDDNVFWELLLASPTKPFTGYYSNGLHFGKTDIDEDKAMEIRRGIIDFVTEYTLRFKDYPYMMNISGRDAYAPMLSAGGNKRRYLKEIASRFDLSVNVD